MPTPKEWHEHAAKALEPKKTVKPRGSLKLFIWEGNGISGAYHDDGTLVVLASTPEEARSVVRETIAERNIAMEAWVKERDALFAVTDPPFWSDWKTEKGQELLSRSPRGVIDIFDGSDEALDREPDRIVELDDPKWVAFNGGGYD